MTWENTVREYMNREENDSSGDNKSMTNANESRNERVIQQIGKRGTDDIRVRSLIGETVYENCTVCRRSLSDDGARSELFHITARNSGSRNGGVSTKSFCNHCAPPHAIDVDVMVKSGGTTSRDAYIYYEIETVFMHESEIEEL